MSIDISNSDDTINTRDVWKRIEELEELEEAVSEAKEAVEDAEASVAEAEEDYENAEDDAEREAADGRLEEANSALDEAQETLDSAVEAFDSDAEYELAALRALQKQAEGYCDWHSGATLINEGHLQKYIQEQIEDTDSELLNPLPSYIRDNIDWDGVVSDLESDYTEVDFDGTSYFLA